MSNSVVYLPYEDESNIHISGGDTGKIFVRYTFDMKPYNIAFKEKYSAILTKTPVLVVATSLLENMQGLVVLYEYQINSWPLDVFGDNSYIIDSLRFESTRHEFIFANSNDYSGIKIS